MWVTNTPGATNQAVAEFTIGLILNLLRHIPNMASDMKKGVAEVHVCTVIARVDIGYQGAQQSLYKPAPETHDDHAQKKLQVISRDTHDNQSPTRKKKPEHEKKFLVPALGKQSGTNQDKPQREVSARLQSTTLGIIRGKGSCNLRKNDRRDDRYDTKDEERRPHQHVHTLRFRGSLTGEARGNAHEDRPKTRIVCISTGGTETDTPAAVC